MLSLFFLLASLPFIFSVRYCASKVLKYLSPLVPAEKYKIKQLGLRVNSPLYRRNCGVDVLFLGLFSYLVKCF